MELTLGDTGGSGGTDGGVAALSTVVDDIAFLARSEHRIVALDALAERPRSRSDLRAMTGVSSSTIGRTLGAFERRNWIRREGHQYGATQLGVFVATGLRELIDRLETEQKLRDVWQWLPVENSGFSVEMVSDAVVTVAEAASPYRPVTRFVSLLRETDRFRFVGFDLGLLEPCKDEFRRRVVDGMRTEIIDPPSAARYVLSTYQDHCSGPLESGNLTVLLHDDVPPFGISIFDDRVGISGYDAGSGTIQVLVDTPSPPARAWAESTYETYRREARPLTLEMAAK